MRNVTVKKVTFFGFFYAFGFSQFERGIRAKTTKPPAMRVVSKNVIQNKTTCYAGGVKKCYTK